MSQKQTSTAPENSAVRKGRFSAILAAIIGMVLAGAGIAFVLKGPYADLLRTRYLAHPVEWAEVVMFCGALAVLAAKFLRAGSERAACRRAILPAWDGKPVPVAKAAALQAAVNKLPRRLQNTFMVRRIHAVLDFLRQRGSATELDDHLRGLTDNDTVAVDESFSLVRFITWAIPILGFLGTVLGITEAVAGVTPEVLEKSLNTVTEGLAIAFDTTALALTLTMIVMFFTFIVERFEHGILQTVDQTVDRELAHRFERTAVKGGEVGEVVRQNSLILLGTMEKLVQGQASVWARTFEEENRRRTEIEERLQQRLTTALEMALQRTLDAYTLRLQAIEDQGLRLAEAVRESAFEHQAILAPMVQRLAEQTEAMLRLHDESRQLVRLEERLHENLTALTGAGAFEEAVHSLTAAIHLLSSRANLLPGPAASRAGPRPGAAA